MPPAPTLPDMTTTESTEGVPDDAVLVEHEPETDEEVDAATGEDVHDSPRAAFPEHLRFDDDQWAAVDAARADAGGAA